jgi:peptidoglycan/LPS O-acetylase OafA/YrhL
MIKTGSTYRLNTYKRSIGTLLAIGIGLMCVFSMYPDYARLPGIDRAVIVAYQSLSRTLWSLMISWIIFLCSIHQGGIVNTILSYPIWIPLARLNYCAYLIHKMVILITIFNQTLPFYYQPLSVMNLFVSNIFFSYVAAIVVHIFFETPFVVLEKKLLKR